MDVNISLGGKPLTHWQPVKSRRNTMNCCMKQKPEINRSHVNY